MSTTQRISRGFHRLGILYAAIPVLAGVYDAYEVAAHYLEQKQTIDWLVPRLGLALILAFVVYALFRAAGLVLVRLHCVALATQPAWQTSNRSAR
jgi:hypothetical protein